jgi:hypothetical protein
MLIFSHFLFGLVLTYHRDMKWLALIAAVAMLAGCQPTPPVDEGTTPPGGTPPNATTSTDPNNPNATATAQPSGGEGIGIVSPAAGGLSPVTGSDSVVGGGGGGVGNAAKGKAKDIAAASSGRSYNTDDQGGE